MRRILNVAVVFAVFAGLSAGAAASNARSAQGEYNTIRCCSAEQLARQRFSNGVDFRSRPGEGFVSLVIDDSRAEHVYAVVEQDLDGDGEGERIGEICDASTKPIAITPGYVVTVWVQQGTCGDGSLSTPTFGKVTARFTR